MERPIWVRIGMWGIAGRGVAVVFMWFSFLVAIAGALYGFRDPRFFASVSFVLAGVWYWLCIRWMDAHGGWEE